MDEFAKRTIREPATLRFFFDGEKITEKETPIKVRFLL